MSQVRGDEERKHTLSMVVGIIFGVLKGDPLSTGMFCYDRLELLVINRR